MFDADTIQGDITVTPKEIFSQSELSGKTESRPGTEFSEQNTGLNVPDWYFPFLMLLLLFIAWARTSYGSLIRQTFQAAINYSVTTRSFNDNSLLQKQMDRILYGLYFVTVGFLLFIIEDRIALAPYGLSGFPLFLLNIGFLFMLFAGRFILISVAGIIFNQKEKFSEYRYNIFVFNKLAGIVIFPFLILTSYTIGLMNDIVVWLSVGALLVVVIMRIFRGIEFSWKKGVFILYLFLYLCALEIIPLMVIFKWIRSII